MGQTTEEQNHCNNLIKLIELILGQTTEEQKHCKQFIILIELILEQTRGEQQPGRKNNKTDRTDPGADYGEQKQCNRTDTVKLIELILGQTTEEQKHCKN